jgi:hypothetical protein
MLDLDVRVRQARQETLVARIDEDADGQRVDDGRFERAGGSHNGGSPRNRQIITKPFVTGIEKLKKEKKEE